MNEEGKAAYIWYYMSLNTGKGRDVAERVWEGLQNKEVWAGIAKAAIEAHLAKSPAATPVASADPGKWSPLDKVTIKPDWMDITKDLVSG